MTFRILIVPSMPTLAANGDPPCRHRTNSPTRTPRPVALMMLSMRLVFQIREGGKISTASVCRKKSVFGIRGVRPGGLVVDGGDGIRHRN
jgi:hypothetical protein